VRPRVVIIGTGNVASQLAAQFRGLTDKLSIAGRNTQRAQEIAHTVQADGISDLQTIPTADLYVIAVSDDAIDAVAKSLSVSGIVAHTSGSVAIDAIAKYHDRAGVFYPLQTFTKGEAPNWDEIPILVEANNTEDEDWLFNLARQFNTHANKVSSVQRAELHVAAVFANNFTNYLLGAATTLMEGQQLDPKLLQPLVKETIRKAFAQEPKSVQTGPARRKDEATIDRHLKQLANYPKYQELYRLLSDQIKHQYE